MPSPIKQLCISNIRFGYACNSSSSHSLIYVPKGKKLHTKWEGYGFGSEQFVLADPTTKARYVLTALREENHTGPVIRELEQLVGGALGEDDHIDHQSRDLISARTKFQLKVASRMVKDPRLVILGGSDGDGHPLSSAGKGFEFSRAWRERYDPVYNYWSLFHKHSGAKIRLYMKDIEDLSTDLQQIMEKGSTPIPVKAYAPELVDVKITDFCNVGCAWCYQNSTGKGKHATLKNIRHIAHMLKELSVFEVAIGGGEPLEHPHFLEAYQAFHFKGIQANFTTRSPKLASVIKDIYREQESTHFLQGKVAFAFSADCLADIIHLKEIREEHYDVNITVQVIDGCITEAEFYAIMGFCHTNGLHLTVLGFKDVGRGGAYLSKRIDTNWYQAWVGFNTHLRIAPKVRELEQDFPLCVDTALVQQYPDSFSAIPPEMYHREEGKFSAYVDAVAGTTGPSSYCDSNVMLPLAKCSDEFLEQYKLF